MKIRKLEIKNIASIEEAVIDFDKEPLSDTDLFLITGTTGSGKTTLLDAICLALYNTTPRIAKSKKEILKVNDDELTEKDPRNILRQNTGYGYSKVYFKGNNDHEYCAEWSVARGKKQQVGNSLSRAIWKISDLSVGICVTGDKNETYKEVSAIINEAVGLDFEQFGRTTMLAQGDFTEFLKSDEADKAAILEKISGTDIYRRIGTAIHLKNEEIKKLLNAEIARHAQIAIMSEDDRMQAETEAQEAAKESETCQNIVKELNDCINWLNDRAILQVKLQTSKARLDHATSIISSEDFKSRSLRTRQWNETIDVRMRMREAAEGRQKSEVAAGALEVLKKDFVTVLCGREAEREYLQELEMQKTALEKSIMARSSHADAYSSCQTIIAHLKNLITEREKAASKRMKLQEAMEQQLPEAEKSYEASLAAVESATKEYAVAEEELRLISAHIDALKLPDLRREKDFLKGIESIKAGIAAAAEKIAATQADIARQETILESVRTEETKEKQELIRLKAEHERRRQTVDRFAKEMRSHLNLHVGSEDNLCPVCGHLVSMPVNDALIDDEYRKIKEEYDKQEKKAAAASEIVNKTAALIKVTGSNLETLQKDYDKYCTTLLEAISSREDAGKLQECGLEELALKIEGIAARISEGEKTEAEQKEIRKKHDCLLLKKHEAEHENERNHNALRNISSDIKRLSDEIKETEEKIRQLTEAICMALEGTATWVNDWKTDPKAFAIELEGKAKAYFADTDAHAKAKAGIERISSGMKVIDSALKDMTVLMPDWSGLAASASHVNDLQSLCIRLNANVKAQKHALTSAEGEYAKAKAAVDEFLASNPAYSSESLDSLDHISQNEYQQDTAYVNKLSSDALACKREYELAEQELQKHLADKPEVLGDDMTIDTLTADKEAQEERRDNCNQRMGELRSKLEEDDKSRALKKDTKKLDELNELHAKWQGFCGHFGSSDGGKLSKIAQSFVLSSLLDAANHHLHNMSPRYRLLVNPGTLNLKLEDKYNGYSTRSTNSISGGESFLVSLALALALADFGQHLGVSTLFIDEGFGTLSGEPLQNAINTLKSLHGKAGRQVGIISHREEIRENIPVQIKVNLAPGKSSSTIEVTDK